MSRPPITVDVGPSVPSEPPLAEILLGTGALALAAAVIAFLLAAVLHRCGKQAAIGLRVVLAGLAPLTILLCLLTYSMSRRQGFELGRLIDAIGDLPMRAYGIFLIVAAAGVLSARLTSRWLARRYARKQGTPVDTFA
ncbi:hypothetical protein [Aurantiacibacter sp. MUD61]|uniref:hypothetical protein n=1 Tax=Aurantiacibacter sp. MUD61 TaxID=3009083 RepID=UPI0022F0C96A|nr:hypothetical protein [Aurantiacibacter sp. MUD61]